ncbi:O-antigen ligase family protein [Arvimicrobium flavum]|uniref:O-antigen ligase family protein n=1 Tax=Arvimicrobium flavum TaxID=3393320 RepID=UPI00237A95A2|nr:O-antigen ligase family protein [Mesorhizobium shangrilense]
MREGNAFVFLTLALCLAVPFGGIGIVALGALYSIAASRLKLVVDATRLYFTGWLRSDAFALNLLILAVTLLELALIYYHGDSTGEFENQLKQYVAALAVLLTIRRYPPEIILWGAAVGCVLAGVVALHDIVVLDLPRAEGPTNAIRFGMIAVLLAMFSWIGAIFGRIPLGQRMFMACAAASGIFAVFASGSRGAVLALPVMLLLLIPRIWRRSRRVAIAAAGLFVIFSIALGLWQISTLRYGLSNMKTVVESVVSGKRVSEHSTRDRVEMLRLSADLFSAHPWVGVGSTGWDKAVADQIRTSPPGVALDMPFNQPHNQYANDLAKGGLVRALGGLAMLLMPLWFFLKRHPFKFRRTALAPLLGVVTCVAYAMFGLTEAVMDLSLTASLYAILVFYLIAASEGAPLSSVPNASARSA